MNNKSNKNRITTVFGGFSPDGNLYNDIPAYLEELKKHSSFLIYVSDNDFLQEESLNIINKFADFKIIKKHSKYDFGSYQLGFQYILKNKELYENTDQIYFCNDSIIWQGVPLDKFFKKGNNKDFYGLTWHAYGFSKKETNGVVDYPWSRLPHIQSFMFAVSKKIADNKYFRSFMKNIKHENQKEDIIAKYEIGLSRMISEKIGAELNCYYPKVDEMFDPCGYFLHEKSSYKEPRLFLKRRPIPPITRDEDIFTE